MKLSLQCCSWIFDRAMVTGDGDDNTGISNKLKMSIFTAPEVFLAEDKCIRRFIPQVRKWW